TPCAFPFQLASKQWHLRGVYRPSQRRVRVGFSPTSLCQNACFASDQQAWRPPEGGAKIARESLFARSARRKKTEFTAETQRSQRVFLIFFSASSASLR